MNRIPLNFDFKRRAEQEMIAEGFVPAFPESVLTELQTRRFPAPEGRDLRDLLWSSIDNTESRDLDQAEYAERLADGAVRVMVGIADVDALVDECTATDKHAAFNATSVYTGGPAFPMLPEKLSTDLTSLRENGDRAAIVIEFVVEASGAVRDANLSRAVIRNHARLTYDRVAQFFAGKVAEPSESGPIPGLIEQLRLQHETSERLLEYRKQNGSLSFGNVEHVPIMVNNEVKAFETVEQNGARDIIESFMVAANVAVARFLRERGSMAIRRVVREPKRWDRIQEIAASFGTHLPAQPDSRLLSAFLLGRKQADPLRFPEISLGILKSLGPGEYVVEHPGCEHEGHFGLAVHDYSHATAPNRRYVDLVMQRLIKSALGGSSARHDEAELTRIAARCTEREAAARHVERTMKKIAAAALLGSRIGGFFSAIITGVSPKGTFARLLDVPAEGRITNGERGLDVGHKIRVRLVGVDVNRGFIDLAKA